MPLCFAASFSSFKDDRAGFGVYLNYLLVTLPIQLLCYSLLIMAIRLLLLPTMILLFCGAGQFTMGSVTLFTLNIPFHQTSSPGAKMGMVMGMVALGVACLAGAAVCVW